RWLLALFLTATSAQADLVVTFSDGNPHDRFWLQNTGCATLVGVVTIDLTQSAGRVLIDSIRGGPGTKDPMPVEIERGDNTLGPVMDGDQHLDIYLHGLAPDTVAVVTLDLDGDVGWLAAPNVGVENSEMAGARATIDSPDWAATALFDATARARFDAINPKPCAPPPTPPNPVPNDGPLVG
ncbi:MAG: hypothetical protein AAF386_14005, partial [Pseudomonadota bacterium]